MTTCHTLKVSVRRRSKVSDPAYIPPSKYTGTKRRLSSVCFGKIMVVPGSNGSECDILLKIPCISDLPTACSNDAAEQGVVSKTEMTAIQQEIKASCAALYLFPPSDLDLSFNAFRSQSIARLEHNGYIFTRHNKRLANFQGH